MITGWPGGGSPPNPRRTRGLSEPRARPLRRALFLRCPTLSPRVVGPGVMEQGRRTTLVPHPRAEMDDGPPGLTRAVLVASYIPRWGQRGLHCLPVTAWGPLLE